METGRPSLHRPRPTHGNTGSEEFHARTEFAAIQARPSSALRSLPAQAPRRQPPPRSLPNLGTRRWAVTVMSGIGRPTALALSLVPTTVATGTGVATRVMFHNSWFSLAMAGLGGLLALLAVFAV